MIPAKRLLHLAPESVEFLDYNTVEWSQVRRSQYWMYQRFHYDYPGPIWNLHQRLMVVPPNQHGDQVMYAHKISVSGSEVNVHSQIDEHGNLVYFLDLPYIEGKATFEVWSGVERSGRVDNTWPVLNRLQAAPYLWPSYLTQPNEAIEKIARELATQESDPWRLADHINLWVGNMMKYRSGVTSVFTTAAQAFAIGEGLCQDYSHIMIAICRVLGIPARYVSGHLLGEGGSHAWVELLLPAPEGRDFVAVPFDPTNKCRAGLKHITIAVGRDYQDVSPTSGYYTAPYRGRLTSQKKVGVIRAEYFDGQELLLDTSRLVFLEDEKRIA